MWSVANASVLTCRRRVAIAAVGSLGFRGLGMARGTGIDLARARALGGAESTHKPRRAHMTVESVKFGDRQVRRGSTGRLYAEGIGFPVKVERVEKRFGARIVRVVPRGEGGAGHVELPVGQVIWDRESD